MKKAYAFLFLFFLTFLSYGQVIAFQDFEGADDNWNYTADPAPYNTGGDVWDIVESLGPIDAAQSGTHFWGMRDLANDNGGVATGEESVLSFENVDVSGQSDVVLSFYYYTHGFDSNDYFMVEVFFDDASQGVDTLDGDTQAWTLYSVQVPDGTSNVRMDIKVVQNGGSDYAGLDNVRLEAVQGPLPPAISITNPHEGDEFDPETTEITVSFTVQNFDVAQPPNGDGYIKYNLNNMVDGDHYSTDDIVLEDLSPDNYELILKLVDNDGNDLEPPVADTVHFTIKDYIQVSNLTELRAGTVGEYYMVTGEVIFIGGEDFGYSVKAFVQDDDAGIMIYDNNNKFNLDNYSLYDGIVGLRGELAEYRGMLEIKPTADPGASSSGNTVTPLEVSISDFNTNHETYESRLIKFDSVNIDPSGDTAFVRNKNYPIYDTQDTTNMRTFFSAMEGVTIPSGPVDLVGIGAEYRGHAQVYPRNADDIIIINAVDDSMLPGLNVYPNPVTGQTVYVYTPADAAKFIRITDLSDKTVWEARMEHNGKLFLPLKRGVYLMQITENGKTGLVKILVK